MMSMRPNPFSQEDLKRLAITDELTGLYNRRYFIFRLNEEIERAHRSGREISLIMLDLDGLKSVNDMYGHLRGDRLLADFATTLTKLVRPFDIIGRYAGDEFVILLPESNRDDACKLAERLRQSVAQTMFPGNPPLRVTTSIGISIYPHDARDSESLIAAADRGLYAAKRQGRNRFATSIPELPPDTELVGLNETRLIGRDEELYLMCKSLQDAATGKIQFIFITGEQGIGSSRLLSEFQRRCHLAGAVVWADACFEDSRFIPCRPIREVLRRFFQSQPQESYQYLRELTMLQRMEFLKIMPDLDPGKFDVQVELSIPKTEYDEFQLYDAVFQFLKKITETQPLVFSLDDIQWLDEVSMKLLIYVLRNAKDLRFLFAGSYRDWDSGDTTGSRDSVLSLIRGLKLTSNIQLIHLNRLNRSRSQDLMQALLGQSLPMDFMDLIYHESEGNPLFIEEIIKSLVEKRIITRGNHGWIIREIDHLSAPDSIRDLITSRLSSLEDEDLQILMVGAVVGRIFDFDTLLIVTGRNEGHLLDVLDRLEKLQLVTQRPAREGERYQITHNKIREVLYEQLDPRRKRVLHQKIANAIERLNQNHLELVAGELAYHLTQARLLDRAVQLYVSAGDKAHSMHADVSALRYYKRAANLIRTNPREIELSEELCLLHQKIASIYRDQGHSVHAINELRSAIETGKSILTSLRKTQIHRSIAEIYAASGRFELASKEIELAEEYLSGEENIMEKYRLEICRSSILLNRGEYEASLELSKKLVDELETKEFTSELSEAIDLTAMAEYLLGNSDTSVRLLSQSLELRRKNNDLNKIGQSYSLLARVFMEASRWEDAIHWYKKCLKIEEGRGHFVATADPYARLSEISLYQGDLDAAEHYLHLSTNIREMSRDVPGLIMTNILDMKINMEKQDYVKAEESLRKAEDLAVNADNKIHQRMTAESRIMYEIANEKYETALQLAMNLFKTAELFGDPVESARVFYLRGRIDGGLQQYENALNYLQNAENLYRDMDRLYETGLCMKEQALIHLKMHQPEIAREILQKSRQLFQDIGSERERMLVTRLLDSIEP